MLLKLVLALSLPVLAARRLRVVLAACFRVSRDLWRARRRRAWCGGGTLGRAGLELVPCGAEAALLVEQREQGPEA